MITMDSVIDPVRQLIRDALAERQLNMSSVSKKLGKNHAYMHQFLDRGIPARLPETVREQLSEILQVPESQLKGGGGQGVKFSPGRQARLTYSASSDKIPVLGGGSSEPVEHVSRPPQLAGVNQAYAVYVTASNMEPRYYPGELVYVHPAKPVTAKAFVLVQIRAEREGEAPTTSIMRFVKRTATKVTLGQLNPPKDIEIKASDLLSTHRIVGSAESSGL